MSTMVHKQVIKPGFNKIFDQTQVTQSTNLINLPFIGLDSGEPISTNLLDGSIVYSKTGGWPVITAQVQLKVGLIS